MKTHRAIAIVLLAFLLGGSSAEVAVQTRRAFQQRGPAAEGEGGDLVLLELRDEDGALIARPRVIAAPGKAAHLILRDPYDPRRVRLTFRVEATREPSGEVSLDYELGLPGEPPLSGRLSATPGVEHALAVGDRPLSVTLLTLPVPSRAFEAFLEAERRIRHT